MSGNSHLIDSTIDNNSFLHCEDDYPSKLVSPSYNPHPTINTNNFWLTSDLGCVSVLILVCVLCIDPLNLPSRGHPYVKMKYLPALCDCVLT